MLFDSSIDGLMICLGSRRLIDRLINKAEQTGIISHFSLTILFQVWVEDKWVVEKTQADEEEFDYTAGDEWRLARRVATESHYDPKQLARYPLQSCGGPEEVCRLID